MRDKSHDEIMVNRYLERPRVAAAMFHADCLMVGNWGNGVFFFVMSGEHSSGAELV